MNIDNLVLDYRLPFGDWSVVEVTLREDLPRLFTNDDVRWREKTWRVWEIVRPKFSGEAVRLTLADMGAKR